MRIQRNGNKVFGEKKFWGWSSDQHKFRNPIRQNQAHTRAIKRITSEVGEFQIIPIVVFSDKADLKITAPNHIVVNWSSLRSAIKQFNTPCILDDDIKKIINKINSANIIDKNAREAHVSSAHQTQQRINSW